MECNFSKNLKSDQFRYLGSILHAEGDIGMDVTYRIKAGWTKWRNAYGVLCDWRIPLRLNEKFYKIAIRPAMLYGTECWTVNKTIFKQNECSRDEDVKMDVC